MPDISVVICTYNRRKYIISALESLLAQQLPAEAFEILVIDNASTDDTAELCTKFAAAHPAYRIRYFLETQRGLSFARNRGIREAAGRLITYIDDDAEAVPQFLPRLLEFFQQHPRAIGAGGKIIPRYPESGEPRWMNRYLDGLVARHDHGDQPKIYSAAMKYPVGCNMTYRKSALQEAGGFNTSLLFRSDDKYIGQQMKKIPGQVWYLPEAIVYHHIDADRVSGAGVRKLYRKTGNEEKLRVRATGGVAAYLLKGAEFLAKWMASLGIWAIFTARGQELKGRYVMLSQWYTLQGFLSRTVFYR